VTRKELQKLAGLRLREAEVLLENGCPDGAYYLAGYAVECALKACIARKTVRHEFPDLSRARESSHDLAELLRVAGLTDAHPPGVAEGSSISGQLEDCETMVRRLPLRNADAC
jgi:HEPN domain-containing protein